MSTNAFFCADTHFGHKGVVRGVSDWDDKSKCRDFDTVEDHDAYLLDQINKKVKSHDTLYHLGDFGLGFAWKDKFKEIRAKINCERIILILGNHDHVFENEKNVEIRSLFAKVKHLHYGKIDGRKMVLCHYAMKTWPWQHHGSIHLHGHSHGNLPDVDDQLMMDVGVDTKYHGHRFGEPFSSEQVFDIMEKKRFTQVDHHRK